MESSSDGENGESSDEAPRSTGTRAKRVFIPIAEDSKISLEAIVADSVPGTPWSKIGVIITHPMPLLGGNLNNNVVMGIFHHFAALGALSCCFNFRGVGRRQGSGSWRGGTERDDVKAISRHLLLARPPPDQLLLVGYSYGSVISSSVADEIAEVTAFAAISYPFGPLWFMGLSPLLKSAKESKKPKLFLLGDQDNFTGVSKFQDRMAEITQPVAHKVVAGVDHFWFKEENKLAAIISAWALPIVSTQSKS